MGFVSHFPFFPDVCLHLFARTWNRDLFFYTIQPASRPLIYFFARPSLHSYFFVHIQPACWPPCHCNYQSVPAHSEIWHVTEIWWPVFCVDRLPHPSPTMHNITCPLATYIPMARNLRGNTINTYILHKKKKCYLKKLLFLFDHSRIHSQFLSNVMLLYTAAYFPVRWWNTHVKKC